MNDNSAQKSHLHMNALRADIGLPDFYMYWIVAKKILQLFNVSITL